MNKNERVAPFQAIRRLPIRQLMLAALVAGMIAAAGCQDPQFKAKHAERDARIQMWIGDYQVREQRRPEYIQSLGDIDRRMQEGRAASLDLTFQTWKNQERRSAATWSDNDGAVDLVIQRAVDGNPQNIPDVWAQMVY
jgi:hypothetical protein